MAALAAVVMLAATGRSAESLPSLSIGDSSVAEGDTNARQAVFVVSLSEPVPHVVEVDYRTVAGTATAGEDYVVQTNQLRFPPGEIFQTVQVSILGDALDEADESFYLELFNPRNAILAAAEGLGIIRNNDPPPVVSISDTAVIEGNGGSTSAVFTLRFSTASAREVTVACSTSNGTARAGSDFTGISRQIIGVPPGQTNAQLVVLVGGDVEIEPDEMFFVHLSSPVNAVLGENVAQGTIVTDDLAPALVVAGYRVIAESVSPANGTVDPGETVTISLALRNEGSTATTDLVATLLTGDGIQSPGGPQSFGVLTAGGPQVSRPFSFTAAMTNCGYVRAMLHGHDGATDLGTIPLAVAVGGGEEFMIHSLSASGSQVVEHWPLTGDDRGGIAVSGSRVFVVGDRHTAHFALNDLSGGVQLTNEIYDGLVSDLKTEAVYLLAHGDTPIRMPNPPWQDLPWQDIVVSTLLRLDGNTGQRTGERIDLSVALTMGIGSGVFAGWGRIVLHNGIEVYDIDPTSGQVTELGLMSVPVRRRAESWAYWGIAEFLDGALHLVYVQDFKTIVRARVPDGKITTVSTFESPYLGDMTSITMSPRLGRWYFHYEDDSMFNQSVAPTGAFDLPPEFLGYADAFTTSLCGNSLPAILRQPLARSLIEGKTTTFTAVAASNRPLHYQWRFNGNNIPGATSAELTLSQVTTNKAGRYSVVVSNAFGAVTSTEATLTVIDPNSDLFDDFDPEIDTVQWLALKGTAVTPVLATNYGGSVSGSNSLWIGNSGDRFAATRPLNTSRGGTIRFHLRLADGSESHWQVGPLPNVGVVLEYSIDDGTHWTELGRYDDESFRNWKQVSLGIPAEAHGPSVQFRWRQLSHSGVGSAHWCLDDVFIGTTPTPPSVTIQAAEQLQIVPVGWAASFTALASGSSPFFYQWRFNGEDLAGATNATLSLANAMTNRSGAYSVIVTNAFGSVTSVVATLRVFEFTGDEFQIVGLFTNNHQVIEHESITGDTRGGIAASTTHVFYTGREQTGRFALGDLSGGAGLGKVYQGLVSDLQTERIYSLGNGTNLIGLGLVTTLIELDGVTLQPTGLRVNLSQAILPLSGYGGIFAGFGRVVLWSSERTYEIRLATGEVTDLGVVDLPAFVTSEDEHVFWGVAEYWGGAVSLVYARDAETIVRTRVPDGLTSVVARFIDLGEEMSSFTASLKRNRWYFHYTDDSQFGGHDETIGYADAAFAYGLDFLAQSPRLKIQRLSGNSLELLLSNSDGTAVNPGWITNARVLTTTNIALPLDQWTEVPHSLATNGLLFLEGIVDAPQRFFRVTSADSTTLALRDGMAEPKYKLRVNDAALSQEMQRRGARLIGDYGGYQLLEANSLLANEFGNRTQVTRYDADNIIELLARKIDTSKAETRAMRKEVGGFKGKRLHLVQFAGPVKPEWYRELKQCGVKVVCYVPHNAYLVYGDEASLKDVQTRSKAVRHVQWEGECLPEFKIHPGAAQLAAAKALGGNEGELFAIQLVADEEANADTHRIIDGLKLAPILKQWRSLDYLNVIVRLPPERLGEIAARPDVVSIQPYVVPQKRDERQGQILAGNLVGDVPSGPGYLAWLASKGFTPEQFAASSFVVDVSDSGIDNGSTTPGHPGLYELGNNSLKSRVAYNRLLGWPNNGSTIGCDGHGTLNAHIVAGYSDANTFPHADAEGYHYGLGIAPFVRVGSSVVFDPQAGTNPDYAELQSRAYQDNARISCNSWGANLRGLYTVDCQQYDALVRDAQPDNSPFPVPGNQEMVIVFAAGNSGPTAGTVGMPGSAKNVICVGASENVHSHSTARGGNNMAGGDGCGLGDSEADNANQMAWFSSRGPCADGRIKPDLVGPGTHVTGGVAQQSNPSATGTALSCFDGSGACTLPSSRFFPVGQEFYTTSSGTSHSCPAIGGGAALLRQYFINRNWRAPSPAMTKAWLMNSARYLTGVSADDTLPSNHQGMGAMNLGTAFDEVPRIHRDQLAVDRFTASGQVRTFARTVVDPARPLRVTLAWTDAPGSTIGNAYNNDLDLTVTVGGQIYRGNVFAGALSVPGGEPDPRNNVESVFLPAGVAGVITVTVTAANINSDGVPGNADPLDQDFALVVYNVAGDEIQVVAAGAAMTAEQCAPTNGAIDPGETVTVALGLRNVGPADTTQLVGTLLAGGGIIAPSGPQNFGGLTMAGEAVSRPFTFTASGGCGSTITATMQLQDGTNDLGTVSFALPMGVLVTNSYAHTNPAAVTISAVDGAVSPHPSELTVSGAAGEISQVVVSVDGLSHTWPADLKMVLVGPQGQSAILMAEAGDGFAVSDLTLAFDDAASVTLPPEDVLASGTWQPVTPLSEFKNANPNGVWRLFVSDHYSSEDGGVIARGWSLALTTTHRVCCVNGDSVDLAITQHDTLNPVALSNTVTYTLVVSNRGPATATAVTLLDELSAEAEFLSAHTSQGSCTQTTNGVRCELGALPAGAQASVQIQVRAVGGPYLTSLATIRAAEPERDPSNDSAAVSTAVLVPSLSIVGSRVVEGNTGSRQAVFVVSLSEPSVQTVEVDYRTVAGTALAGADFMHQTNRLRWLPAELTQTIMVPILGDDLNEEDESFRVQLFHPRNAALAQAEATGTILDDDAPPAVSISGAEVIEGNTGTTSAVFTISLSAISGRPVTVTCATSNGTARAGSDFAGILSQAITLGPGQLSTNLAITVMSDTEVEPDETFWVYLSDPANAVLGQSAGQGTIVTDELAPAIVVAGYRAVAESFSPANEIVDPGETVTISLALRNEGSLNTTNLTVTLLADGGVHSPSGPQNYGALPAGGAQVLRPFSFTAGATNCGYLQARLQMHDGDALLYTVPLNIAIGGGHEFIIHSLSASGSEIVELQPGGLGGVAVSHDYVFIANWSRSFRHALDLSDGTRLDASRISIVSDLRSESVYLLGQGATPIEPTMRPSGTIVNSLLEVDGKTGALTGRQLDLSSAIRLWSEPGCFAGWGRIVLHNGLNVYDIDTTSGEVTDLGAMNVPPHQPSPDLAYRGVAEFFDGAVHLVYVRDSNTVARTRVPDGATAALATFRHLGRMASITVSPRLGRWYFSYGGEAQFGGMNETLGYADALATPLCGNSPPLIVSQPLHRSVMIGGGTTFAAEVANKTSSYYQWRFNGNNIEGATTATMTLNGVTTNHAGRYSVLVSNAYGSVTSGEATLTVVDHSSGLVDDFDPDIDLTQWSVFDGAVGDSIQATDYADSVSSPNSLWFSHSGDRVATTRSVDTRAGGVIVFYLRMAKGAAATWETVELPAKGITLEYSVNDGASWTEINRYTNGVFHYWTPVVETIPSAAQRASAMFRWRQLSHAASMAQDHWALDDVFIGTAGRPPMIVISPKDQTVAAGWRARFEVAVESRTTLSYQWQFNGRPIADATNASLMLTALTSDNAGSYSVFVSNAHGAVTSPSAMLTIVDSTASPNLFDDFDPGIDWTQWSAMVGILDGSLLATNHAGNVSGSNSLLFGDYSRSATTRSLLVPDGWMISFYLRFAQGNSDTWETLDLPSKGVVLEYLRKGQIGWREIGRYTNSIYYQWTKVVLNIPAEAQGQSVQFKWRQLINNGSGTDHWALDDVFVGFAPPLSAQLDLARVSAHRLNLLLSRSDGGMMTSDQLARLQILTTTNLALPLSAWQPLVHPLELTNGVILLRAVETTNGSQQFFRAVEHE